MKYITIVNDSLPFTEIPEMERGRMDGKSVAINDTTIWVTGGISVINTKWNCTIETEFLTFNHSKFTPGPILPMGCIQQHCMIKLNESMIVIAGGYSAKNKTYLVDISKDFTFIEGPLLKIGRHDLSCGTFKFNNKTIVIVSGGIDNNMQIPIDSTELWDPTTQDGWVEGKLICVPDCYFSNIKFNFF